MQRMQSEQLTPVQQVILDCARGHPGQFTRSGLAKLLVGSKSSRLLDLKRYPSYGRLAQYGRKEITDQIDILLQQGFLGFDSQNRLVLKANPSD